MAMDITRALAFLKSARSLQCTGNTWCQLGKVGATHQDMYHYHFQILPWWHTKRSTSSQQLCQTKLHWKTAVKVDVSRTGTVKINRGKIEPVSLTLHVTVNGHWHRMLLHMHTYIICWLKHIGHTVLYTCWLTRRGLWFIIYSCSSPACNRKGEKQDELVLPLPTKYYNLKQHSITEIQ